MLNVFPIQFLAMVAYFILRVALGVLFVRRGTLRLRSAKNTGTTLVACLELCTGLFFILGFLTQITALVGMLVSMLNLSSKNALFSQHPSRQLHFLMFVCSLSLFITGAGAFAFDLPI